MAGWPRASVHRRPPGQAPRLTPESQAAAVAPGAPSDLLNHVWGHGNPDMIPIQWPNELADDCPRDDDGGDRRLGGRRSADETVAALRSTGAGDLDNRHRTRSDTCGVVVSFRLRVEP